MKVPYQCPYCDQRSTRRWNLEVHIKRKHGEYSLGRSSDRYMTPPLYSQSVQLGHATVADNTFHPQQAVLGTSQYTANPRHPQVDVSPNFANPMFRPMPTMNDQSYGTGLTQDKVLKIEELKRLMNKYAQYHTNPDEIIKLAILNSINGDDTFIDDKLKQLRNLNSLANIKF